MAHDREVDLTGSSALQALFARESRKRVYRVAFTDGDLYDLADILTGEDRGEKAHADSSIVAVHRGRVRGDSTLFFYLDDVLTVVDPMSGEQLYDRRQLPGDAAK